MELNVNRKFLLTFDVAGPAENKSGVREFYSRDIITLETAVSHLKEAELRCPETSWEILVHVTEK